MRNYIKYPSWGIRRSENPSIPRGPSFNWAREVTLTLDDNTISLRAPSHAPSISTMKQIKPSYKDNALVCGYFHSNVMPTDRWKHRLVLGRDWGFYGPWGLGNAGNISFSTQVITENPETQDHKPSSFFHPRTFEDRLCDYLSALYEHKYSDEGSDYLAPMNWAPWKSGSVFGVRFDIAPHKIYNRREHVLAFPISERHILLIGFSIWQTVETIDIKGGQCSFQQVGPKYARFHVSPLLELVENVINTVKVELSPKNQKAFGQVKSENPVLAMQVSETMMPLKWPESV